MTITKDLLLAAKEARVEAERDYRRAIARAREEGWNNCEIARVLGTTEAAVRMYFRRHPDQQLPVTA